MKPFSGYGPKREPGYRIKMVTMGKPCFRLEIGISAPGLRWEKRDLASGLKREYRLRV
jgi:hypothetical protein